MKGLYSVRRMNADRRPIRWAVLDAAGAVVREFGGDRAPTAAER